MPARFYVDSPFCIGQTLVLPEKTAHHASRVLRMREGDEAALFDGKGREADVVLHFFADRTEAEIVNVRACQTESPLKTVLIQALVSQEKLDWILEKATELGVTEIIIAPSERSVTRLDAKRLAKRLEQWNKTVQAACEQCQRGVFASVYYKPNLKEAFESVRSELKIILAPGANACFDFQNYRSIAFAVGPEGGFSAEEIRLAQEHGFLCRLMGPRVLRTETAGLAALAVAQWQAGDFQRNAI